MGNSHLSKFFSVNINGKTETITVIVLTIISVTMILTLILHELGIDFFICDNYTSLYDYNFEHVYSSEEINNLEQYLINNEYVFFWDVVLKCGFDLSLKRRTPYGYYAILKQNDTPKYTFISYDLIGRIHIIQSVEHFQSRDHYDCIKEDTWSIEELTRYDDSSYRMRSSGNWIQVFITQENHAIFCYISLKEPYRLEGHELFSNKQLPDRQYIVESVYEFRSEKMERKIFSLFGLVPYYCLLDLEM